LRLSPQEIVNCNTTNNICRGACNLKVFEYIKRNGIRLENNLI
jgi:hypothetical protein